MSAQKRTVPHLSPLATGTTLESFISRVVKAWDELRTYLVAIPMPETSVDGRRVQGGLDADFVVAVVRAPDTDIFVPHKLGRIATHVMNGPVEAYSGGNARVNDHVTVLASQKAAQVDGTWIRAHFAAPVTNVRIPLLVW